jgi:hypothetical protein
VSALLENIEARTGMGTVVPKKTTKIAKRKREEWKTTGESRNTP